MKLYVMTEYVAPVLSLSTLVARTKTNKNMTKTEDKVK